MWYETIYSTGLTGFFILGVMYMSGPMNMLDIYRPHRRSLISNREMQTIMRDHRLTGNYYKINGLESIPDAE